MAVKVYLISLAAGLLVGIVYGLLNVRSPAPPVIALVGLLGILLGEQVLPLVRRVWSGQPVTIAWARSACAPHLLGTLPTGTESTLSGGACGGSPADADSGR
jgi:XapX domain-containing protein